MAERFCLANRPAMRFACPRPILWSLPLWNTGSNLHRAVYGIPPSKPSVRTIRYTVLDSELYSHSCIRPGYAVTIGVRYITLSNREQHTVAKTTSIQLIDDIDGSVIDEDAGESIEFSVSGVDYVIDLKSKNATEFHRKLDYYIEHATRVGGRKRKPSAAAAAVAAVAPASTPAKRDPAQTRAIRQWAFDSGYELSSRGRIPAEIEEAYNAAH